MKATITNAVKSVGSDDRGVSPVIGVILMVAITVILAAVIGTMVLGMTDSVGQNVQAGANVQFDDTSGVAVTFTANQNAETITLSINGVQVGEQNTDSSVDEEEYGEVGASYDVDGAGTTDTYTEVSMTVGQSGTIDVESLEANFGGPGSYHVVVTAHNGDSSTVVVDKTVNN